MPGAWSEWARAVVRAFEGVAEEAVKCGASDWFATAYVNGVRNDFSRGSGGADLVAIVRGRYELLLSMAQTSSPVLRRASAEFERHFALAEAEWRLGGVSRDANGTA